MTTVKHLLKVSLVAVALSALFACSDDTAPKKTNETQPQKTKNQQQNEDSQEIFNSPTEPQESKTPDSPEIKKGLYVYHQDKATFIDCSNNQSYPVAKEGNFYELEATYIALKTQAQQKLLFEVKGDYAMRPPEQGDDVDMLIPTELLGVVHKENCP
ncbi:MAG: hypothetical protein CMP47_09185 [Rickettsiales bacterium]|jgi:uncharacterized lipoprotein NlpE involved in copper resistance|nr:hypothetical protein [Rickettsiales bacterium]